MKLRHLFTLFAFAISVQGLVFPLTPDGKGEYDAERNVISSFEQVWQTNHHAILNFHNASGVAIAPRWVLTADHLARGKSANNWFNDDFTRYYVQEVHSLDGDLAVVKVDRPMPHYTELCKTAPREDEIVTVYGQSAAAKDPLVDQFGRVCGWQLAPDNFRPALRWGFGRLLSEGSINMSWPFTSADPELGLNCAATATNDSGGGIFLASKLAGIITDGSWLHVRTNEAEPFLCDPNHTAAVGQIFDGSTLFNCYNNQHPRSTSSGEAVSSRLSAIFALISPQVRFYAGTTVLETNGMMWKPFPECTGCSVVQDDSPEPVDASSIANPPPPQVYRSALVVTRPASAPLAYDFDEMIRYERYSLRLHFAPAGPCVAPEVCRESVSVNEKTVVFDPFAAPRKANELIINDVLPDEHNRIHVEIRSANPQGNVVVSGLELDLVPAWLGSAPPTRWRSFSLLQEPSSISVIAYGNGRFVASSAVERGSPGMYFSDDFGTTWFPARNFVGARQVIFANDRFVAVNESGISYSFGGRNWTQSSSSWNGSDVVYGNGVFISPGRGVSAISYNGQDWTFVTNKLSFDAVAYGNGYFLSIVSSFGGVAYSVYSSNDAVNWHRVTKQNDYFYGGGGLGFGNGEVRRKLADLNERNFMVHFR